MRKRSLAAISEAEEQLLEGLTTGPEGELMRVDTRAGSVDYIEPLERAA